MRFIFSLVPFVLSKTLILTPKPIVSILDLNTFNEEHDIHHLASVNDLHIYKTTNTSYLGTLTQFFDIEEEQIYKVDSIRKFVTNTYYDFFNKVDDLFYGNETVVPWHLDRISKRDLPLDNKFKYTKCNTNKDIIVNNYVIDTGVDTKNENEFQNRVTWLNDFTDGSKNDIHPHGTHCAGVIGSKTYGLCKDSNIFSIRVLDQDGSGSTSGVIAGIEFFHKHHTEMNVKGNVKSIASVSLGGGKSTALNKIVEAVIKTNGVYFVAASGNSNEDACDSSPASARGILSVNAVDQYDTRAYFSNFGKCTDIYASGVDILSTVLDGQTAIYSGTSCATPQIAGLLTHYLNEFPNLNMKELKAKVLSDATKNHIKKNPKQTPNNLAYLSRQDY